MFFIWWSQVLELYVGLLIKMLYNTLLPSLPKRQYVSAVLQQQTLQHMVQQ